jgi:uncharacterized membrane protein YeaQ/YmgE (transglycosylase-associated protein family)
VLIFAILGFGMLVGATAQVLLGRSVSRLDWGIALVAGFAGSFIGGLLVSLLAGDGLALRPSGFIGSIVGAIIVTAIWHRVAAKKRAAERQAAKATAKRRR